MRGSLARLLALALAAAIEACTYDTSAIRLAGEDGSEPDED